MTGGHTAAFALTRYLSSKLGSYKSPQVGVYGQYVEPVLHAAEHTRSAVGDLGNAAEIARAKDQLKCVRRENGLCDMDFNTSRRSARRGVQWEILDCGGQYCAI